MPRRRHHSNNTAGDGRLQSAGNVMLMPARNAGAVTGTDPAATMSLGYGTGVSGITGSVTGVTPYVLGAYLNEFYQGIYRNIAPIWEVYERRDDACAAVRRKRILKFKKELKNWDVQITEGFDQDTRAEEQRQFLKRFFGNIRVEHAATPAIHGGMSLLAELAADSLGKQYAFLAKRWERVNGELRLTLRYVPLWFFGQDKGEFQFYPDWQNTQNGVPVSSDEWVIVAQTTAIMEAGSVACLFKRLPMHQLVRILEKWGIPNVYGKTTSEPGSPAYLSLYNAVSAYISDMVAVISGDGELKPVESKFQSAALHRPWIDRMDRILSINWLGGDLGTMAQAGTGTLAGGAQADDVDDLISSDCEWFSEVCQEQIAQQAIALEFGDTEPLAYFSLAKPDAKDDESDRKTISLGVRCGVPIGVDYFRERFGIPDPADGEQTMLNTQTGFGADPDAEAKEKTDETDETEKAMNAGDGVRPSPAPSGDGRRAASHGASAGGKVPAANAHSVNGSVGPSAGSARGGGTPPLALNAKMQSLEKRADTRQRKLDNARAKGLPAFRRAYAALFQPLLEQVKKATDANGLAGLDRNWKPAEADMKAFGDVMAASLLMPAIKLAQVPVRPEIAQLRKQAGNSWLESGKVFLQKALSRTLTQKPLHNGASCQVKSFCGEGAGENLLSKRGSTANNSMPSMAGTIPNLTLAEAQALGFQVAGITSDVVLGQVWDLIEDTANGLYTVDELADMLETNYGVNSAHADTIALTNVQNLYNYATYVELNDPVVKAAFPQWMFLATLDDRTTITCSSLHGQVWPADDPVWSTIYPPLHYNCRSTVMPLGADEDPASYGGNFGGGLGDYPLGSINPGFGGMA